MFGNQSLNRLIAGLAGAAVIGAAVPACKQAPKTLEEQIAETPAGIKQTLPDKANLDLYRQAGFNEAHNVFQLWFHPVDGERTKELTLITTQIGLSPDVDDIIYLNDNYKTWSVFGQFDSDELKKFAEGFGQATNMPHFVNNVEKMWFLGIKGSEYFALRELEVTSKYNHQRQLRNEDVLSFNKDHGDVDANILVLFNNAVNASIGTLNLEKELLPLYFAHARTHASYAEAVAALQIITPLYFGKHPLNENNREVTMSGFVKYMGKLFQTDFTDIDLKNLTRWGFTDPDVLSGLLGIDCSKTDLYLRALLPTRWPNPDRLDATPRTIDSGYITKNQADLASAISRIRKIDPSKVAGMALTFDLSPYAPNEIVSIITMFNAAGLFKTDKFGNPGYTYFDGTQVRMVNPYLALGAMTVTAVKKDFQAHFPK